MDQQTIPVFQMIFTQYGEGADSLLFSNELRHDCSQNIAYAVPMTYEGVLLSKISQREAKGKLALPFAFKEKMVLVYGTISFPFVRFSLDELGVKESLMFVFLLAEKPRGLFKRLRRPVPLEKRLMADLKTFSYEGNWIEVQQLNTPFVVVSPLRIEQLDQLYLRERIVPVGFTPVFGDYEGFQTA